MGTVLLPVLVALVAGLAAGALSGASVTLPAWLLLIAAWAAAAGAFHLRYSRTTVAAVVAGALAAGWLLGADQAQRALHPPIRALLEARVGGFAIGTPPRRVAEPMLLEGRLVFDASPGASGVQLRLEALRLWPGTCPEPVAGGVALTVAGTEAPALMHAWTAGRIVRVPALLRRPTTYRNDGVPDQERQLARRGITLVGSVKSGHLVTVHARGHWLDEAAALVRARSRRALMRIGQGSDPPLTRAVAAAILIGDRAGLDVETSRRLQEAGTYHVIAISGGNIAILAALAFGVLGLAGLRGRVATVVTIAGLVGYAFLTGGGPSVTRATVMAVIYLAVRLIDQRTAAVNAIVLTAILLLLAAPLTVFDVGFWLTFGATTAIVLGAAWVRWPARWWLAAPAGLWLASVCSEVALTPIGAAVFERVTVAGLALNFIAIPCMTAVQLGAMAVVVLDLVWGGAADVAALATDWAARGLLDSARLVDAWPWLSWRVAAPAAWTIAAYYVALAVSVWSWRPGLARRRPWPARRLAPPALLLLGVVIVLPPGLWRVTGDGRLHVTMIDVGQGDAMLVTFPRGTRLLLDAGGLASGDAFDIGDRIVGPALRARGVGRLDYLAISHGHPDHAGGLARILRDFGAREVWEGVPVPRDTLAMALGAEAVRAGAPWRQVQRGDVIAIDGVAVRVLHPPLPDWERQQVRNDDSMVLEIRHGDVAFVLTGDIGREVERDLLPWIDPAPLVVLKVPHHGSNTSSSDALLDHLRPAAAFIGVGRTNHYGHPAPAVLSRYRDRRIPVYRTDLHGQIDITTDGQTVEVSTFAQRARSRTNTKITSASAAGGRYGGTSPKLAWY
ncbi:MAG: DNA internalization-related competence protein ComEC/Rec2 [Vicinamibacterales bacterium]|nr:DNA internalization-related competence protein ComEC/Rec2 [Vicinamibacterales bacterium]